jgi:hypothetical protein
MSKQTACDITHRKVRWLGAALVLLVGLALGASSARGAAIFSTGLRVPEGIALAPAGFGDFGGSYFVGDTGGASADRAMYRVPAAGGTAVRFASTPDLVPIDTLFLPQTGTWNAVGGPLIATGYTTDKNLNPIWTFNSSGVAAPWVVPDLAGKSLTSAVIAPTGFGSFEGQLIAATYYQASILAISPTGQVTTIASNPPPGPAFGPFGLAVAPAGFGSFAGQVLVSDVNSGLIYAASSTGQWTQFANIPGVNPDFGLRQMIFAPADFLPGFGPLLLVSNSGSGNGGGQLGDIFALDAEGTVVETLKSNLGLPKFDPRGMLFAPDGELLVSDTSDPIYRFTAADFQPAATPEPSTLLALLIALGMLVATRSRGVA